MTMIQRIIVGLLFTSMFLVTATEPLHVQAVERLTVTIKVTSEGLKVSGIGMQDRRMIVPRGAPVRLVLDYADTNRNAHKFTLTAKNTEITSPTIDGETRKASPLILRRATVARSSIDCPVNCPALRWMNSSTTSSP